MVMPVAVTTVYSSNMRQPSRRRVPKTAPEGPSATAHWTRLRRRRISCLASAALSAHGASCCCKMAWPTAGWAVSIACARNHLPVLAVRGFFIVAATMRAAMAFNLQSVRPMVSAP
eukprot:1713263-Amphidinium_carterae.1